MKYITLLRHGKASADSGRDFNRVLTEEGIKDSELMGNFIKNELPSVDTIFCSSAVRAAQTAEIIAGQLDFKTSKINATDDLYDCNVSVYFDIMAELPPTMHHVLFVGHNPEVTSFLDTILNAEGEDLEPCELAHVTVDTFKWEDVDLGSGELIDNIKPEDLG